VVVIRYGPESWAAKGSFALSAVVVMLAGIDQVATSTDSHLFGC
jgi:hypothetical protein